MDLEKNTSDNEHNKRLRPIIYLMQCLTELPQDVEKDFLPLNKLTDDQKKLLDNIITDYFNISQLWCKEIVSKDFQLSDPRAQDNKVYLEIIHYRLELFQSIWNLINYDFTWLISHKDQYISTYKKSGKRLQNINTPSDLFISICREDAYKRFSECLVPYIEISREKTSKKLDLARKMILGDNYDNTTPIRAKKLDINDIDESKQPCLAFIIVVCGGIVNKFRNKSDKIKKVEELEKLYKDFKGALGALLEMESKAHKRTKDTKNESRLRSYNWRNGKIQYADKTGGTYGRTSS